MCPVTLGLSLGTTIALSVGVAGAVAAAATSITQAGVEGIQTKERNENMMDSLEAQYEAEQQMANEQFILDQQQLQIETMEAQEDASATDRDNKAEVLRMKAEAESAMSGLNISGGTSLRTLGAFEIMEADIENEGAVNKERIKEQFYLGEDSNQQKRVTLGKGASAKHRAGWNPTPQNHWANVTMGGVSSGIKGAATGISIGTLGAKAYDEFKKS